MKKNQEGTLVEIHREHFLKFLEDNRGFMKNILELAGTSQTFVTYIKNNPNDRARDALLEKIALAANRFEWNGFKINKIVKYDRGYLIK